MFEGAGTLSPPRLGYCRLVSVATVEMEWVGMLHPRHCPGRCEEADRSLLGARNEKGEVPLEE